MKDPMLEWLLERMDRKMHASRKCARLRKQGVTLVHEKVWVKWLQSNWNIKAFVISQNIRVVCHYLTFDFTCGFLKAQRVNSRF